MDVSTLSIKLCNAVSCISGLVVIKGNAQSDLVFF
jgi:hypothetical protein